MPGARPRHPLPAEVATAAARRRRRFGVVIVASAVFTAASPWFARNSAAAETIVIDRIETPIAAGVVRLTDLRVEGAGIDAAALRTALERGDVLALRAESLTIARLDVIQPDGNELLRLDAVEARRIGMGGRIGEARIGRVTIRHASIQTPEPLLVADGATLTGAVLSPSRPAEPGPATSFDPFAEFARTLGLSVDASGFALAGTRVNFFGSEGNQDVMTFRSASVEAVGAETRVTLDRLLRQSAPEGYAIEAIEAGRLVADIEGAPQQAIGGLLALFGGQARAILPYAMSGDTFGVPFLGGDAGIFKLARRLEATDLVVTLRSTERLEVSATAQARRILGVMSRAGDAIRFRLEADGFMPPASPWPAAGASAAWSIDARLALVHDQAAKRLDVDLESYAVAGVGAGSASLSVEAIDRAAFSTDEAARLGALIVARLTRVEARFRDAGGVAGLIDALASASGRPPAAARRELVALAPFLARAHAPAPSAGPIGEAAARFIAAPGQISLAATATSAGLSLADVAAAQSLSELMAAFETRIDTTPSQ
jgi:hypothetical protein